MSYPFEDWTASVAKCETLADARKVNARWAGSGWTMDYFVEAMAASSARRTCAEAIALLSFFMPAAA